ncbi:MAG TPA: hypothetical protein PLB01_13150 [Thermoanaerobaculia bacterium]|nr:hypothetical protein [Thermoanaerobaculia bacterium]
MISVERDSSGRTYQIWKQDQLNSCGVASAWMARGIVMQMSLNEDEWSLAQRIYRQAVDNALAPLGVPSSSGPMSLNPGSFANNQSSMASTIANFGFYAAQLAHALRAQGLKVEHVGFNGQPRIVTASKISISKPAIALVCWNGGGGHFVVVGRATQSLISFLDPWDGRVNEQPNNGRYRARYNNQGYIGEILYLSI